MFDPVFLSSCGPQPHIQPTTYKRRTCVLHCLFFEPQSHFVERSRHPFSFVYILVRAEPYKGNNSSVIWEVSSQPGSILSTECRLRPRTIKAPLQFIVHVWMKWIIVHTNHPINSPILHSVCAVVKDEDAYRTWYYKT